jgi:hypothetical protein
MGKVRAKASPGRAAEMAPIAPQKIEKGKERLVLKFCGTKLDAVSETLSKIAAAKETPKVETTTADVEIAAPEGAERLESAGNVADDMARNSDIQSPYQNTTTDANVDIDVGVDMVAEPALCAVDSHRCGVDDSAEFDGRADAIGAEVANQTWDVEFFRHAFQLLRATQSCAHCKQVGTLQGNGVANNTYRVKCVECAVSTSGANPWYTRFFEANFCDLVKSDAAFFARYPTVFENRLGPGNLTVPRPGERPQRKRLLESSSPKASSSSDEDSCGAGGPARDPSTAPATALAPGDGIASSTELIEFCFVKCLKWQAAGIEGSHKIRLKVFTLCSQIASLDKSDAISAMRQTVVDLVSAIDVAFAAMQQQPTGSATPAPTPIPRNPKQRVVQAALPLFGLDGASRQGPLQPQRPSQPSLSLSLSPSRAPPPASPPLRASYAEAVASQNSTSSEEDSWRTIGKNGQPQKDSKPRGVPPPPRTPLNAEGAQRILEGKSARPNELVFLYVFGLARRTKYYMLRQLFRMLHLESRWVPEMAWMPDGTLELLVHAERSQTVQDTFRGKGLAVSSDYNDIRPTSNGPAAFLEGMRQRLARRLTTLNPQQRGVRYHIQAKLEGIDAMLALQRSSTFASHAAAAVSAAEKTQQQP